MNLEEPGQIGYQIFREHTTGVPVGFKGVKQGCLVVTQADDGEYTVSNFGDLVGQAFWDKNTRDLGGWSSIYLAVKTASGLLPVSGQGLAGDGAFDHKTVVTSPVIDDHSTVRAIDGNVPDDGEYGFVIQGIDQDAHGQIFIPIAAAKKLQVDHTTGTNYSTKVYGTQADGSIDPANIGNLKQIWRVYSNHLYLLTTAKFYQSTTKKGPLLFQTTSFPALAPPDETPFIVETKCAFDVAEQKWRWYTEIGGGGVSTIYARVRFVYEFDGDFSEAEIATYNIDTDKYDANGTPVWIDIDKSKTIRHETAGDDTIFEIQKVRDNVSRNGIIRNLYRVTGCVEDLGYKITHFRTNQRVENFTRLMGWWLSTDLSEFPWVDPFGSRIITTILGQEKENKVLARVPAEWELSGSEDYAFLETSDFSRGYPFYFRPILPVLNSIIEPQYRSYITWGEIQDLTIAFYRRKS